MADPQIHPSSATPPPSSAAPAPEVKTAKQPNPQPSRPIPPPAAYVVQLPRDQILRYPPPENATKFQERARQKDRRRRRCCCCCLALCLLILVAAAAISAAVMCLVYDFKSPRFDVTRVSIRRMNLTSAAAISPVFDVSIRAENRNGKVGVYYMDSTVNIVYKGTELGVGASPAFYQPRKSAAVLRAALTGLDGVVVGTVKTELRKDLGRRRVPFVVNVHAPVKFKVGSAKTWEMTFKVSCSLVVDALNDKAKIVASKDRNCHHSLRFW